MTTDKPETPENRRDDLSGTDWLVTGRDKRGSLTLGESSAHEILDVISLQLGNHPERGDLWMMRFEIQRTLGQKHEFINAMREGYRNPRLRGQIDWHVIRKLWDELAPTESPPADVSLPGRTITASGAVSSSKTRRFSDLALELAEKELDQLAKEYQALRSMPDFFANFARSTHKSLKRPTPLQRAEKLEREYESTARIFLKREDQHPSTPELDMAVAQSHVAKMMNRHFIMAGNDVDDFSLALARTAPDFGLRVSIVVGLLDMDTKSEFVSELKKLGAEVEPYRGGGELKSHDPREGALRMWMRMNRTNHLAMSFGTGPHPYPRMISDFQMLLGYECELQLRAQGGGGRPHTLVAAVHSEADSIGFMLPYLKRTDKDLFYAEPAGNVVWKPSARLRAYNGAKREHSWLRATGRISHIPVVDDQARAMQEQIQKLEGIAVGLEDARAAAVAVGLAKGEHGDRDIVVLVA